MPLLHVFVLRFQLRKNRYDTAKVLKKTQNHFSVNIIVKKKYFWNFYLTISKCIFYSNIQPKTRHISISNNSEHLLNTIIPPYPNTLPIRADICQLPTCGKSNTCKQHLQHARTTNVARRKQSPCPMPKTAKGHRTKARNKKARNLMRRKLAFACAMPYLCRRNMKNTKK